MPIQLPSFQPHFQHIVMGMQSILFPPIASDQEMLCDKLSFDSQRIQFACSGF